MKGVLSHILIGVLGWSLLSCSPKVAPVAVDAASEAKEATQLQEIRVVPTALKTEVFIVGQGPMTYTTFHLTEPDRLVIDILGVGLGAFTESISIPEGPIVTILPKTAEDGRVARIEMETRSEVRTNITPDGVTLHVEASVPPEALVEEKAAVEPSPMMANEKKEMERGAEVVSAIRFDRKKDLELVIVADGALSPHLFYLDAHRLVIDLPEVRLASKIEAVAVNDRAVKQVRVGEHPDKLRLVVDLLSPVEYSAQQAKNELRVTLKEVALEKIQEKIQADATVTQKVPASRPTVATPPDTPEPFQPASKYVGRKISLDFRDAEIADIIRLIAEVSGLNIVLSEDVKGKMTLKLVNVPWDQALDTILTMNTLGQEREGSIIVIATLASITQRRDEEAKAKESGMKAEDRITRVIYLNYAEGKTMSEPLKKLLSPRGDITVDERTNTLIVKDIEENMEEILRMAKTLDTRTPQVSIEARIVQVAPRFNRSLGVRWGANYRGIVDSNLIRVNTPSEGSGFGAGTPDFAVNVPASTNFGGLGFTFGRFTDNPLTLDLRLSAGETQGLTKIVSTPKITVLDNQQAVISQGESIPFQTTSAEGTQTTFIDAALNLKVTPHISADGGIVMKVSVTKNAPGETRSGAGPSILKKEATTNVLVVDGETVVIGGIQETTEVESISGIPLLMRIPIIGWLFKNKDKRKEDSELLVFITPRIIR